MSLTVDDLVAQAEALPDRDRALLVERLMLTLHDYRSQADEAWKVEIERRVDSIESGEETCVPWEVVRKDLGLA